MDANSAILSCRDVWKIYGGDPAGFLKKHGGKPSAAAARADGYIVAVGGVSLEVCPGEILVVMGLSGSGKSTLVRCLSRLVEPTSGAVFFEGRDLLQASAKELTELRRHRMGMVFQHFALLPHRTVLQNVAFPLEVQGAERKERETRAGEMLQLVGLAGRENYYPRELSGGQQQRVGIARSLAVKPDLWFLDEPFSALDPLIRREMQDEFLRLQAMLKKTIVFITHDFDEAIRLADRIAIMFEGEIVQIGEPEEIVLHPRTDYVREFVKDVSRDKIVTVGSVMIPNGGGDSDGDDGSGGDAVTVRAEEKLAAAAGKILAGEGAARVTDEGGKAVGTVSREAVLSVLFGGGENTRAQP